MRSGKNFVINMRFAEAIRTEPPGHLDSDIAFCGKTKTTIYRVFLKDLLAWIGRDNYSYNKSDGTGVFYITQPDGTVIEREFYSFGYSDENSQDVISGSTFGLAYLTEGIFCQESFHKQMLARLSVKGAKLFGDTNPSGPHHWLYKNVINNLKLIAKGAVRAFGFNFDSNLSLDPEYKEQLKEEYGEGSVWYKRLILGLWVAAEGVIFNCFKEDVNTCTPDELPTAFDELYLAMDYGTTNPFVVGLFGQLDGTTYLIDCYDYDGGQHGQKRNGVYLADIAAFAKGYADHYQQRITTIYCDPSAASFKAELEDYITDDPDYRMWRELGISVQDANNDVEPGIQTVYSAFHRGRLIICNHPADGGGLHARRNKPSCFRALEEVHLYTWDPKATARGKDEPIKKDDHAMDMIRYALHTRKAEGDPYAAWR